MSNTFTTTGTAIDSTLSSLDMTDSYATLVEGVAYMATRLDSRSWNNATDEDKEKALITASRNYIGLLNFKLDEDVDDGETTVLATPNDYIKQATILVAAALLDGFDPEADRESLSVRSTRMRVSETFDRPYMDSYRQHGIPSYEAWKLLVPYLRKRKLPVYRIS